MKQAEYCPIDNKAELPWSIPLPEANILNAPDIWRAILDSETKNKGRMIAVLYQALSNQGVFGNNCPQEVRDKIKGMML
jgi:hypothetical protein